MKLTKETKNLYLNCFVIFLLFTYTCYVDAYVHELTHIKIARYFGAVAVEENPFTFRLLYNISHFTHEQYLLYSHVTSFVEVIELASVGLYLGIMLYFIIRVFLDG